MLKIPKEYLIVLILSFSILMIDFFSKSKIISIFKDGLIEKIFVNDFLDFILVFNTGISYGLFSGGGNLQKWVLIILSLLIIFFLLTLVKIDNKFSSTLGISFIVGGAIGNVLDRIIYGAVVDFISLHARGFSWYIFNIADIFIVSGVLIYVFSQFNMFSKKRGK